MSDHTIVREKQIKTTIDNHFVSTRMAIISKRENSKCWQECEKLDFCALLLGMWKGAIAMTNSMVSSKNHNRITKIPSNSTSGHFSKGIRSMNRFLYIHVHSSINTISNRWKQPNFPSTNEQINKMWYIHIIQRRKWQPTPVFLPGKSLGQRSLAGYSPWSLRLGRD